MTENGFPILLKLDAELAVVIGGGRAATRKISSLLETSARVVVISPEITERIAAWEREGRVSVIRKPYSGAADLAGSRLAFAATDQDEVNARVGRDAANLGIPVNDAGKPSRSTFILPAVLRRGRLVIAVSTSGASPGLAGKIRDELAAQYGSEYEMYVAFLSELRERVLSGIDQAELRTAVFQSALKFDILEVIRSGKLEAFRTRLFEKLNQIKHIRDGEQLFQSLIE